MCLVLPKEIESKILEEDLRVYKIVQYEGVKVFSKQYGTFEYKPNKLYETEIKESDSFLAFDYFDDDAIAGHAIKLGTQAAYNELDRERCGLFKSIGQGFHSMIEGRRDYYENMGLPTRSFIIPKGAEVYEWNGLMVSNKIIMK